MWKKIFPLLFLLTVTNLLFAQDAVSSIENFFLPKTTIGGYGELHFNQEAIKFGKQTKTLDFHRFVVFIGHSFSEKWSFKSEIEIEHNFVEGGQGELAIEQANINFRANKFFGFRVGVILNSVGIINEIHEPPTFLSVERPEYSKYIVPTTWYGNGASIFGKLGGFDYVLSAMEGLDGNGLTTKNIESSGIRKGRVNGFKSDARSILLNGRINYFGFNGIIFGGSFTFNNAIGDTKNIQVALSEFHFNVNKYNIVAVGEMANIAYGNSEVNNSFGYYFDLGYNLSSLLRFGKSIIPFVRYTNYNTAFSTKSGGNSEKEFNKIKWMIGLSFKPVDEVVFKVDYAERKVELNNAKTRLFNFGIGYMF